MRLQSPATPSAPARKLPSHHRLLREQMEDFDRSLLPCIRSAKGEGEEEADETSSSSFFAVSTWSLTRSWAVARHGCVQSLVGALDHQEVVCVYVCVCVCCAQ